MEAHVATFLDEVARWAAGRQEVRAAVLLGSQARVDAPADPASDVDVALFVDEPAWYLDDTAWIDHFGEPLLSLREPTAVGGFEEQRVLFRVTADEFQDFVNMAGGSAAFEKVL